MGLQIARHEKLSLKDHPQFSEAWLEDCIKESPDLLGLGEVEVLDSQRIQESGGRLDLLLYDRKGETRYEVELMLGPTDPSHIIRCIEYWDVERRRYPAYEHVAVLVAEDVTTRFLNVLSLMAGSIPIIAIKLNVLKIGDQIVLDFVQVLNQIQLREDDVAEASGPDADRAYWESRVGSTQLQICDVVLDMINERARDRQALVYRKGHIGLSSGLSRRNFVYFYPKKSYVHVGVWVSNGDAWISQLEEVGLPVNARNKGRLEITLKPKDLCANKELISRLIHQATDEYQA